MSAFMGKGKSALATEFPNFAGTDQALVQQDLILPERNGALDSHFLRNVFRICVSCQPTDASIAG